jgi:hypothetical protein
MPNFGKHLKDKKRKFLLIKALWFVWYEKIRVERVYEERITREMEYFSCLANKEKEKRNTKREAHDFFIFLLE